MATKKRKSIRPAEPDLPPAISKKEEQPPPAEVPQTNDHEEEDEEPDFDDSPKPSHDDVSNVPDDDDFDDDIAGLLEPLSRDQLVSLIRVVAGFDRRAVAEIRRAADRDPANRKLFIHGLNWTTTADALRSYFAKFGEVEECKIVSDRNTGKSKGYGFILFRHRRAAILALREPQKSIDGRMTSSQLASVGPVSATAPAPSPAAAPGDPLSRKIFVGNVHADVSKERLVQFFSQFGEIEEGPLGFDRQTGKAKGYALFIYKTVEGARKALQEPSKSFEGKLLYCQKATESQKPKPMGPTAPGPTAQAEMPGFGAGAVGGPMGFPGGMDLGFAQGLMPFAQANPAALAMLAANPAAFGVPPAMMASLNPAMLAAAMNQGGNPVGPPAQAGPAGQSFGGFQGVGLQGQPGQQSGGPYQATGMRSGTGPMSGYGPR